MRQGCFRNNMSSIGLMALDGPNARGGHKPMDNILMILFGSVLCTTSALTFMELRRIRKRLEIK
jgi:hypothetical protein